MKNALTYLFFGVLFCIAAIGLPEKLEHLNAIPSDAVGFVQLDAAVFTCGLLAVVSFLTALYSAIGSLVKKQMANG